MLSVLDGAVLVVSAVEGVQAQTRVLMRALQRLRMPTLVFVNKIDRRGRATRRVLRGHRGAADAGGRADAATARTPDARVRARRPAGRRLPSTTTPARPSCDGARRLRAAARGSRADAARAGAPGVLRLGAHRRRRRRAHRRHRELLPSRAPRPTGRSSGTVFKIERGPAGEQIAYVRLFVGHAAHARPSAPDGQGKVTAIDVFERGAAVAPARSARARSARSAGSAASASATPIGDARDGGAAHHFAPPTLETVVVPRARRDRGRAARRADPARRAGPADRLAPATSAQRALRVALRRGAEGGHPGDARRRLRRRGRVPGDTTICIERPAGSGAAFEIIERRTPNPFLATVGLRVDPAPVGAGVVFRLEVELGSMPYAFFRRSRRPCARRCGRACTAGRSPTAR